VTIDERVRMAMRGTRASLERLMTEDDLDALREFIKAELVAAIEGDRKSRPHLFVGSFDRDCELCGNPDRDEIHVFNRERLERAIAEEREACAKVAGDYESTRWHGAEKVAASEIARKIRARSNVT